MPVSTGSRTNPPSRLMPAVISWAAPTAQQAVTASASSNHCLRQGPPRDHPLLAVLAQIACSAAAKASGTAASTIAILSATTAAVSRTQSAATVYQRRGPRSTSRKIASSSTWVPT